MKTDIFAYFLENALFFWMIIWMKNVNKFQIAKIQPKDAAQPIWLFDNLQYSAEVNLQLLNAAIDFF